MLQMSDSRGASRSHTLGTCSACLALIDLQNLQAMCRHDNEGVGTACNDIYDTAQVHDVILGHIANVAPHFLQALAVVADTCLLPVGFT